MRFINSFISGWLLFMEVVIKTFILLVEAFVGQFVSAFVHFCARFFIVHEYGSLGHAIFDKSIARVKCYMSVD